MKPRPIRATLVVHPRSNGVFASQQCRRNIHVRAIARTANCQTWRHNLQRSAWDETYMEKRHGGSGRYASTSTAAASKTQHRGTVAAPPPAKGTTSNTSSKPLYSSKLSPRSRPSTSVPAKPSASTTTTVPTLLAKERLNPPPFTYAPELSVPARQSDQSRISWLWKAGRAYLTFYKTGISHVRQTSKLAKQLRAKVPAGKDASEALTRAEWQILLRSRKDTLRLPAMGALILVLGEWLPLVVLYLTPLIPEACRIPQQVHRDLMKREKRRADRLRRVMLDAQRLQMQDKRPVGGAAGMDVDMSALHNGAEPTMSAQSIKTMKADQMTMFELVLFSAKFDCHSRIWDVLFLTPPKFWMQRNVRKTLTYLVKDDELIERDGGFAALGREEVQRVCVERGLAVLGKKEDEMRREVAVTWKGGKA